MIPKSLDPTLIVALYRASTAELLEARSIIERLLVDPGCAQHEHAGLSEAHSSAVQHAALHCGDKVTFEVRYLQPQTGTIVSLDQRTATIDTGDRNSWRIALTLLQRVPADC